MDDTLALLQWPAMAVTVVATWLVAARAPGRRNTGFWLFLLSNGLWVAWGLHAGATALVLLQFCLAALNMRGASKSEGQQSEQAETGHARAPHLPKPVSTQEPAMNDKRTPEAPRQTPTQKDPQDWVTGDEPMTAAQRAYLKTLCGEAQQPFDEELSKAEASRRIEQLQALTGRGATQTDPGAKDKSLLQSLGEAVSAPVLDADESVHLPQAGGPFKDRPDA